MTSCSNRKTRLSLALDIRPASCSLTEKVSCWSSFPWAVIFPWDSTQTLSSHRVLFVTNNYLRKISIYAIPQNLGAFPHSSYHYSVLARNTSPPPPSDGSNWMNQSWNKIWVDKLNVNIISQEIQLHNEFIPAAPQHPSQLYYSISRSPVGVRKRKMLVWILSSLH